MDYVILEFWDIFFSHSTFLMYAQSQNILSLAPLRKGELVVEYPPLATFVRGSWRNPPYPPYQGGDGGTYQGELDRYLTPLAPIYNVWSVVEYPLSCPPL